jgi:hypothetical protein
MPNFSSRASKKKNIGQLKIVRVKSCESSGDVRLEVQTVKLKIITFPHGTMKTWCDVNEIIHILLLSNLLQSSVLCKESGRMGISMEVKRQFGLAAEIKSYCKYCVYILLCFNSRSVQLNNSEETRKLYSINIGLIYTLWEIGKVSATGEMLRGIINIQKPRTKFRKYYIEDISQESMKDAVEESVG